MKFKLQFIVGMTILLLGSEALRWADIPVKEEMIAAHDVSLFVRIVGDPVAAPVLIALTGGPGHSSHFRPLLQRRFGPTLCGKPPGAS